MINDKALIFFTSLCVLVFCGFVVYAGYTTYKESEESAYLSCILSMKSSLIIIIRDDQTLREAIDIGHEWKSLNKNEMDTLFNSPANTKRFDCGNYPSSRTGEDLQIAIRQINGRIEMNLQINGRIDTTLQEIN